MTPKEALQIKTVIEAAYPNVKPSKESDLVYISIFQDYDVQPMLAAAKEHIKACAFPPTIADLLRRYDNVQVNQNHAIISIMQAQGYFHSDEEIRKASQWITRGIIPDWFKRDMARYNQKQLDQTPTNLLE